MLEKRRSISNEPRSEITYKSVGKFDKGRVYESFYFPEITAHKPET